MRAIVKVGTYGLGISYVERFDMLSLCTECQFSIHLGRWLKFYRWLKEIEK
jgi:hypothetical protein